MNKTSKAASGLNSLLFAEQLGKATIPEDFVHPSLLAERFMAHPDPVIAEFGGNRVEVAIGVGRDVYQLEVKVPVNKNDQLAAYWVKADTVARKVKGGVPTPLQGNKVPVTMNAAITSLCETFGLCRETVLNAGVNLMSFWTQNGVGDQLETPMSADWAKHSLAAM